MALYGELALEVAMDLMEDRLRNDDDDDDDDDDDEICSVKYKKFCAFLVFLFYTEEFTKEVAGSVAP